MSSSGDFFSNFNAEAVGVAFAFKDRVARLNRSNASLSRIVDEYREDNKKVRGDLADEKKRHAATIEESRQKGRTIEKLRGDLTDIRLLRQELDKAKAHNAKLAEEISGMRDTIRFQAMATAGLQKVISLFTRLHPDSDMLQLTRHKDKKGNKLIHWLVMYNEAFDEYGRTKLKIRNPETYREAP